MRITFRGQNVNVEKTSTWQAPGCSHRTLRPGAVPHRSWQPTFSLTHNAKGEGPGEKNHGCICFLARRCLYILFIILVYHVWGSMPLHRLYSAHMVGAPWYVVRWEGSCFIRTLRVDCWSQLPGGRGVRREKTIGVNQCNQKEVVLGAPSHQLTGWRIISLTVQKLRACWIGELSKGGKA